MPEAEYIHYLVGQSIRVQLRHSDLQVWLKRDALMLNDCE